MCPVVTDLTDAELSDAGALNEWRCFSTIARLPGSRTVSSSALSVLETPIVHAQFNGAFRVRLSDKDAERVIDELIVRQQTRKSPFTVWFDEKARPESLPDLLVRRGFAEGARVTRMVLDLFPNKAAFSKVASGNTAVADESSLDAWLSPFADAFSLDQTACDAYRRAFVAAGFTADGQFHHVLVSERGEPAATASVFLDGSVAGIYDIATRVSSRRRGFGSAATHAAIAHAMGAGYRYAVLTATDAGQPLFRKLSFHALGVIRKFILPASGG